MSNLSLLGLYGYEPQQYWAGDMIYCISILLAASLLVAGLVIQCHREGFPVHKQPRVIIFFSFVGIVFGAIQPLGWIVFVSVILLMQTYGHHGQWIMAAVLNFTAFVTFWWLVVSPKQFWTENT